MPWCPLKDLVTCGAEVDARPGSFPSRELLINRQGQQLFEKENTEDMEVSEDIRL